MTSSKRTKQLKSLLVLSMIFPISCSNDDSSDYTSITEWIQSLEKNIAIYSFFYTDPPPQGTHLSIFVFDNQINDPCSTLAPGENVKQFAPFRYMAITIDNAANGTYSFSELTSRSEESTQIIFKTVDIYGKGIESWQSASGIIEIAETPTNILEWETGINLIAHAKFTIYERMLRTNGCSGAADQEGHFEGYCDCVDDHGAMERCILNSSTDKTCCIGTGELLTFEIEINAKQCSWLCKWPTGLNYLAGYCTQLNNTNISIKSQSN